MYRARPHLRSDARRREDAQALAEGELLCSRPVPRGWTSAGGPSVSDRRWCRLDRQRRLLNRLWLLTLGSRARPVAEPVHREGGSPCKSAVTEFTHPTRSTKISSSFGRSERPKSRTSATRLRTAGERYDQTIHRPPPRRRSPGGATVNAAIRRHEARTDLRPVRSLLFARARDTSKRGT